MKLRVVLGTMTYGSQTQLEGATAQLAHFVGKGHAEVDTARMYNKGATETMLGAILGERADLRGALRVASKANTFAGYDRELTAASVERQFAATAEALKATPVDVYYLHNPDPTTPILETLEAVDALHKCGKIKELGLSNYASWEVCHIHHLCETHGFVKPTVYQGMYNAITRDVERELLPCLRALGMRFYAYNLLCGGLLACARTRESYEALDDGSRFSKGNTMYRERYLRDVQLDSVDAFREACAGAGVPPVDSALRWLQHHSRLVDGDGIIVGASSLKNLEENLSALESGGGLPRAVIDACDSGWGKIKASGLVPSYERGTSLY